MKVVSTIVVYRVLTFSENGIVCFGEFRAVYHCIFVVQEYVVMDSGLDVSVTSVSRANLKKQRLSIFSLAAASFVDKVEDNAVSILWPAMYRSLGIQVGRLGLVLGISQLISTLMLPIWGYAVDRFSRKALLVWVTGIWGLWTLGIGFVQTLPQLLVVRVFSAVGLGVFVPAAFSLISDIFHNESRGRAAGMMEGIGLFGLIVAFGALPILSENNPEAWRTGFMVLGGASFFTGILLAFLLEEPVRGSTEPELEDVITEEIAAHHAIKWSDLRKLVAIPSWRSIVLKDMLDAMSFGIFTGWAFTWLDELNVGENAFIVVVVMLLGTIMGNFFLGWFGDRMERRYPNKARVVIALIGLIVSLPLLTSFFFLGGQGLVILTILGTLVGFANSATAEPVSWPMMQAIFIAGTPW